MGSQPLSCPRLSFSLAPPTHLSIISPVDLHSPQPPFSCPLLPRLPPLLLHLFQSTLSPSSSSLHLFSLLISPFHLTFYALLASSSSASQPFLSEMLSLFSRSLSVMPPTYSYTHMPAYTHTMSSYFPSAKVPFDLSKCSHRMSIDLCIEMQCVWVRAFLFTLLNVTWLLASSVPFRVCVWVLCISQKRQEWVLCALCLFVCECVALPSLRDCDGEGVTGLLVGIHNHPDLHIVWWTVSSSNPGLAMSRGQCCNWRIQSLTHRASCTLSFPCWMMELFVCLMKMWETEMDKWQTQGNNSQLRSNL